MATTREQFRLSWADVAVAAVIALVQVGGTAGAATHQKGSIGPLGFVLLAAAPVMLLARRRHPVAVMAGVLGVTLWYWTTTYPRGPVFFALIAALFAVVKAGHRWAAVTAVVAGYVGFQWLPPLVGTHKGPTPTDIVLLAAWLLLLLVGSEWVRARSQRRAALAHSRQEEARRQASEERLRIARELHDVVAHNISLINVQAATALHLMDRQPERAREALAAIKDVSKEALVELRSILGVLRQVDEELSNAPAPTLARLDELVARTRQAGVEVRLEQRGQIDNLPSAVDQAAYRITQEALTNVARHAAAARATVRLATPDGGIVVEIDDDGRGSSAPASPGGNGIAGMRERARALGGTLQAGPRPDGGFRVRAWLPVPEADRTDKDRPNRDQPTSDRPNRDQPNRDQPNRDRHDLAFIDTEHEDHQPTEHR
jgi:signal transduction histidine kinase